MKNIKIFFFATLFTCVWCNAAIAVPIADSITEFSNTQGQNNWSYGFFNQGGNTSMAYSSNSFQAFDTFNSAPARWEASDSQVGANHAYPDVAHTESPG